MHTYAVNKGSDKEALSIENMLELHLETSKSIPEVAETAILVARRMIRLTD